MYISSIKFQASAFFNWNFLLQIIPLYFTIYLSKLCKTFSGDAKNIRHLKSTKESAFQIDHKGKLHLYGMGQKAQYFQI